MAARTLVEIEYPTSDGRPFAETDYHRIQMFEVIQSLDGFFLEPPDVYVSGNLLVYYEEGNPRKHLAPDCFVVSGVPKQKRLYYKIWEEGKAPEVVFEITSKTTKAEDTRKKMQIYRDIWKVKEYFLFDPFEEYLDPSMQGYRLVNGEFVRIESSFGRLHSEELGLQLEREGIRLVLRNPLTGRELIPKDRELRLLAEAEKKDADAEIAQLRAEIEALRNRQSP